jgi:hypothetical protein
VQQGLFLFATLVFWMKDTFWVSRHVQLQFPKSFFQAVIPIKYHLLTYLLPNFHFCHALDILICISLTESKKHIESFLKHLMSPLGLYHKALWNYFPSLPLPTRSAPFNLQKTGPYENQLLTSRIRGMRKLSPPQKKSVWFWNRVELSQRRRKSPGIWTSWRLSLNDNCPYE